MINYQRKVNPYSVHGCFCVNVCEAFRSSNKLVQSKNVCLQGYRFQHQNSGSEIPNGDGAEWWRWQPLLRCSSRKTRDWLCSRDSKYIPDALKRCEKCVNWQQVALVLMLLHSVGLVHIYIPRLCCSVKHNSVWWVAEYVRLSTHSIFYTFAQACLHVCICN